MYTYASIADSLNYSTPITIFSATLFDYRIRKWYAYVKSTKYVEFKNHDKKKVEQYIKDNSFKGSLKLGRGI